MLCVLLSGSAKAGNLVFTLVDSHNGSGTSCTNVNIVSGLNGPRHIPGDIYANI